MSVPSRGKLGGVDMAEADPKLKALREALIEGEESGNAGELDMRAVRANAKRRAGLLPADKDR